MPSESLLTHYWRGKNLQLWNEQSRSFLTFIDTTKSSVVHLVWTIENNNVLSQAFAHVFSGLCFPCPSRSCWCTTHTHAQGLCQSDVTPKGRTNRSVNLFLQLITWSPSMQPQQMYYPELGKGAEMHFHVVSPQSPPLHTVKVSYKDHLCSTVLHSSSTAMTAAAQEIHRPILNAEYQNTVTLWFSQTIIHPSSMTQPHSVAPRATGFLPFSPSLLLSPQKSQNGLSDQAVGRHRGWKHLPILTFS